ncbi:PREDICTED: uncharacterized protein LOC109347574 isoform X2 [Lupinus angustifolius]|uniref:uncharacterized protein LOC109347574 isoform X2 n=1 Tax=Lupinus angustifolius TaxID=3871 RepID=UPI00092EA964|nr:PREDICTED: uncharacterized protein LOC109347574 isoform X2 [Lupinus angustifolius]
MGDKGEKSCPICTEEMDLTDQQLKPCKCGYEICVWCWHHIIEMAQKDETEGRCPACRSPYDKERIEAMALNCQRLVAEMNSKYKRKMQKLKPKSSEGRKHLTDVRVIQRNLVYIIGLPLNLAHEDLLQQREYFGRYGKVLKVSISRTATGMIQHSAKNSCCVYITYSKESEAVRCIQSVHCFVLEGRSLRACFGTTKYCHAWLRNVPCSNRDCLYLHDYGSQEDSFTKDELMLAFARSRVQQIIGATNNLNRCSGSVLPPPAADSRHTSSATDSVSRNPSEKIENQIKGSCSGIGADISTAIPAVTSWIRCVSGNLIQDTNLSCSGTLFNRKVEASNDPQALVSVVASTERSNLNSSGEAENGSEMESNGVFLSSEFNKHYIDGNSQTSAFTGNDQDMVASSESTSFLEISRQHCDFDIDKVVSIDSNKDVQGLCSGLSSVSMCSPLEDSSFIPDSVRLHYTHNSINSSSGTNLWQDNEYSYSKEHSTTPAFWEDIVVDDVININRDQQDFSKGINNVSSGLCSSCLPQNVNQSNHQMWSQKQEQICNLNQLVKPSESFSEPSETGHGKPVENKDITASDMGENTIISNILSLELDAWEDSLVKLLDESGKPYLPLKSPTLRKVQDKSQSRFSFARQDNLMNDASDLEQSFGIAGNAPKGNFASAGLMGNKDTSAGKYPHVSPSSNSMLLDKFVGSQPFVPSKYSVSTAHSSSPLGFAMSSRVPPRFSLGRVDQDNSSVKYLQQQYAPPSGNIGRIRNIEINDLPVWEVGSGMLAERLSNASFDRSDPRQTSLPQFSPSVDDARLRLLMQQSTPQNLGLPDHVGNILPPQNDAYRTSSRFLDQFQSNSPSIIYEKLHSQRFSSTVLPSNNQWGGWND